MLRLSPRREIEVVKLKRAGGQRGLCSGVYGIGRQHTQRLRAWYGWRTPPSFNCLHSLEFYIIYFKDPHSNHLSTVICILETL